MARQKKTIVSNVSKEHAADAFAAYNEKYSALESLQAEMNTRITEVRQDYDTRIGDLQEERDQQFEVLQVYAAENPNLFEKKKSVEWTHGTFGYRTGTPKLKTRKGFTWASVLILVKGIMSAYVRSKEEINKELLIADREKLGSKMQDLGIEVDQDETFYVLPSLDEVATA